MTVPTNIGGNHYDKYNSGNLIARWLMRGFLDTFERLCGQAPMGATACEVGCGEGHLTRRLHALGWTVDGFDLEAETVAEANATLAAEGLPLTLTARSLLDLEQGELADRDLVICCEVLEHLPDPEAGLAALARAGGKRHVLSVPREPIWRALNMARGRYLGDWGNTPGHLNHWSSPAFERFIGQRFTPMEVVRPLPWTFIHATLRP